MSDGNGIAVGTTNAMGVAVGTGTADACGTTGTGILAVGVTGGTPAVGAGVKAGGLSCGALGGETRMFALNASMGDGNALACGGLSKSDTISMGDGANELAIGGNLGGNACEMGIRVGSTTGNGCATKDEAMAMTMEIGWFASLQVGEFRLYRSPNFFS